MYLGFHKRGDFEFRYHHLFFEQHINCLIEGKIFENLYQRVTKSTKLYQVFCKRTFCLEELGIAVRPT